MSSMRSRKVGHSRWNDLRLFLISLLFVGCGILVLVKNGPQVGAWLGILFFAVCGLIFLCQLVTGRSARDFEKCKDKISFDDAGFTLTRLKGRRAQSWSMTWSEISSVFVFKRDLFIVDCVCMLLARENGTRIEVDEEMEGWEEFTSALTEHLPGCIAWGKWFWRVVSPAFATNWTEIFSRKSDQT